MKIQKVQVTGAKGSTVDCGYFSNALYDTYLQLTTTAEIGKQYNIHGYIKSNRSGTIRCQDMTANVTTSWQEIKMIIIPTSNILELYFYPGEFYLYNWKMEAGTISSAWTPSPLDVKYDLIEMGTIVTQLSNSISSKVWQNDINTATGALNTKITEVKQNADKISWLVKSGSSESDMVLTDTTYTLISKNINLKGNAIFTSFLNEDQTAINGGKIATNSITASQLSTDSIKSRNYIENTSGSFLNLSDGTFQTCSEAKGNDGIIYKMRSILSGGQFTLKNITDNNSRVSIQGHGMWLYNSLGNSVFSVGKNNESCFVNIRDKEGNKMVEIGTSGGNTTSTGIYYSYNHSGNYLTYVGGSTSDTGLIKVWNGQSNDDSSCMIYIGTNTSTNDDETIDYKGFINISNCVYLGRENTFTTKTWFNNVVYVNDNSNLKIWHNSRKKYGNPVTYMNNPVSIDWDGTVLRIYVDNVNVASWVTAEQRWE